MVSGGRCRHNCISGSLDGDRSSRTTHAWRACRTDVGDDRRCRGTFGTPAYCSAIIGIVSTCCLIYPVSLSALAVWPALALRRVDSLRKLWADQEARDRSAITAAKFTVGIQEETIHETSGVGAGGSPMRMGAAGTGGIDDASDPIPFVHSLPAAAAAAPAVATVPQVPRVPVAVRPSARDQAGAGSGTPSFTPPYDTAGGDGSAGQQQQQGGSGMSVEQAIKMRNDYNALVATVVQLQAEREGLSTAVMKREGEIQKYREKVASLEGAAAGGAGSGASGATGLRQRRGAGGAAVSADPSDDAGNDDTTTAGGEGRGFPLYTVLLIAFVMFLIGRLTSGMF